jgi:hypothetical protein
MITAAPWTASSVRATKARAAARGNPKCRTMRLRKSRILKLPKYDFAGIYPRVKVQPAGWVKIHPAPTVLHVTLWVRDSDY